MRSNSIPEANSFGMYRPPQKAVDLYAKAAKVEYFPVIGKSLAQRYTDRADKLTAARTEAVRQTLQRMQIAAQSHSVETFPLPTNQITDYPSPIQDSRPFDIEADDPEFVKQAREDVQNAYSSEENDWRILTPEEDLEDKVNAIFHHSADAETRDFIPLDSDIPEYLRYKVQ